MTVKRGSYNEHEFTVREKRGSYNEHVVGCIPSFCWIIKRKDLKISLVDIAYTG
jgi:hypothetical protein